MSDEAALLLGLGLLGGGYLLFKSQAAAAAGATAAAPAAGSGTAITSSPAMGLWQQGAYTAEAAVQKVTGVPVAALGNAALAAPTWVKAALLPVAATALAQAVITHPLDTAKSAINTVDNAAKKVGGAVESAASSAYHALSSIF